MSRWLTVLLLVAVMVAASVGSAAAYSALSIGGGSVVTDLSIEITVQTVDNVNGQQESVPVAQSKMIQVPGAAYIEHGGVFDPVTKPQRALAGILDIACNENDGAILDVYIDFKDSRSLMLLASIKMVVDNPETGTHLEQYLFTYTDDTSEGTAPWSGISASIPMENGYNQTFSLVATYKSGFTPDPSAFAGSNIRSNVMFLLKPVS